MITLTIALVTLVHWCITFPLNEHDSGSDSEIAPFFSLLNGLCTHFCLLNSAESVMDHMKSH